MTFSRGLSTGWLEGIDNQKLVHARFGKKRGLRLGVVERIERDGVWLALDYEVKAGDGVVFDRGRPDEREEGGRITSVDTENNRSFIRFLSDSINWQRVNVGDTVYKTSDPALDKALRQSYEVEQPNYKRPITATVRGQIGQPLILSLQDEDGRVVEVESNQALEAAQEPPADDRHTAQATRPPRQHSLSPRITRQPTRRRLHGASLDAQSAAPRRRRSTHRPACTTAALATDEAGELNREQPRPTEARHSPPFHSRLKSPSIFDSLRAQLGAVRRGTHAALLRDLHRA